MVNREGGLSKACAPGCFPAVTAPSGLFTGTPLGGRIEPIHWLTAREQEGAKVGRNCSRLSLQPKDFQKSNLCVNLHRLFLDCVTSELKVHGCFVMFEPEVEPNRNVSPLSATLNIGTIAFISNNSRHNS